MRPSLTVWTVHVRLLRAAYDAAPRGTRADLERVRDADLLRTEGAAWKLLTEALPGLDAADLGRLVPVLYLFRFAAQRAPGETPFRFGTWLRTALDPTLGARLFTRLARAETTGDLTHQVARVLRAAKGSVEWGALGAELVAWTMGEGARRRVVADWMMDYYVAPRGDTTDEPHDTNEDDDDDDNE